MKTTEGIVSTTVRTLAAAGIVLATVLPAAAQDTSLEYVRALIAKAAQQTAQPAPPPQEGALLLGGPKMDLTAEEAVQRAIDRNPALASARLTPQTFDYARAASWANYRPNLTSMLRTNSATQLSQTTVEGGSVVNTDTNNWNAGMTQNLRWGGGNYQATWNNNRTKSTRTTGLFNPTYASTFGLTYTQPLMQNFKLDNTRFNLRNTQLQQDISELDLRATMASTVAQVRNAYWELVFAYQAVDAAQRSLDLSSKLVQDNRSRVEIGTMAPIDIVQAQAEEATRRQQLVAAQATLRNNELALKRLIVTGTDDDMWKATINPTDRPSPGAEPIDLEAAVTNGLRNRTDLETTRKNVQSAELQLSNLRNQSLPQLNLATIYQLDGRGGTPNNPSLPPGGWLDSLNNISRFDAPTWSFQLNFAYPLGQSAAEANMARQKIIIQQNQTAIKTTELQIATDITAAALAVRNAMEAVQASGTSRELSEQRLQAIQSKYDVGMSTNYEIVQAQRDLNDARNSELRALLNYRKALVDFQRAQVSPR
jgi:outer membrane protein TolC